LWWFRADVLGLPFDDSNARIARRRGVITMPIRFLALE
jgi:hypothetical protein